MPITYTLHPDLGLVITRFTGRPTEDEFIDLYRRLLSDPDYQLGTNELADAREAKGLDITAATLRQVDALHRERYAGSDVAFRTAILTPRDQPYGMARIYQVFSDEGPESVKVCRATEEALAWLGLDASSLEGVL